MSQPIRLFRDAKLEESDFKTILKRKCRREHYNNRIVLLSPKSRTHGTLDLKFHSPYFTLGRQVVKATWRTLHLPCLRLWMGTHGWSLLLILGLCPSRATSFESWSYFISVVCPGSRVFIFTVTQDHTREASSSRRVNASSFP